MKTDSLNFKENLNSKPLEHKKILIDNPICKRRFHLVCDETVPEKEHVVIKCPHCSVTLFEAENHTPVMLVREENLIYSPMGEAMMVYECKFKP